MVLSELKEALQELERLAYGDMTDQQTSIWGEDPGHILLMHARFLQAAFAPPRESWRWDLIRESWEAVLERRHLPFAHDWLTRYGDRVSTYLEHNEPRAVMTVFDRLGRVHTLQRA